MATDKHIRLRPLLPLILLTACVSGPWAIWRHAQARWLRQEGLLREQAGRLAKLSAENQRLSNLMRLTKVPPLAHGPPIEVLRLRGEIGVLRQLVNEMEQLRAANHQLEVAATNSPRELSTPPAEADTLAHWPKEKLAFAGYGDPASALQTALWAMSRGDASTLADTVTPEARTRMTREVWVGVEHGPPAEEIAASTARVTDSLSPSVGFSLVGQKLTSPQEAILDVYFDGEGKTRKFALRRIGSEWKLGAIGMAGGEDHNLGEPVWP